MLMTSLRPTYLKIILTRRTKGKRRFNVMVVIRDFRRKPGVRSEKPLTHNLNGPDVEIVSVHSESDSAVGLTASAL